MFLPKFRPRQTTLLVSTLLLLCLSAIQLTASEQVSSAEHSNACAHLHGAFNASLSRSPSLPTPVDSPDYRKYAPDRKVDFQHITLDLTPNFQNRTIRGSAKLKFTPLVAPLEELRLDAINLTVSRVSLSAGEVSHQITAKEIVLNFSPALPPGKTSEITIHYSAEPLQGLYFRTKEMGYRDSHLWTQGESIESRHWFPCFDHPIEKLTSEVICHLPTGMIALSNGKQVSVTPQANGLTTFHWIQDKPHAAYLISLVAGELAKIEDRHRDIPLEFWTPKSDLTQAKNSFRNTRRMMEFFEKEIGVPYPWAKYGQVAVRDYHWGGMENTSLTTLNANTLFSEETENLFSSDGLVAHELAHQWFGDLVTCKDWSHTWLNEGFATYYDWLWTAHDRGNDDFRLTLLNSAKGILSNTNETRGIVWRKFSQPSEMFNYLAYPKGAWVLHMLRSELGPALFQKAVRSYLESHAFGSVTTDQLRNALEQVSGRSLERFFDQWVYGVGAPVLDVAFHWDEKTRLGKLSVKQTQKITEEAPLFQFPLTVRFQSKGQNQDRTVQISQKEEEFYFPLDAAPEIVRIDPLVSLLAKIQFKIPRPMAFAMLADRSDPIGQILALNELAEKPDQEAVAKIESSLQSAPFYGVRERAAEVLKQSRSRQALEALLRGPEQHDPRVRNAVANALGGYLDAAASQGLLQIIRSEKNPGITASALRSLGPHQNPETREVLVKFLSTPCYRDRLAEASLNTMRRQDDPTFYPAIEDALLKSIDHWPTAVSASALETLGYLHRNEGNREPARERLAAFLNHPKERLRTAAINALGSLENPRSIPALETFSQMSPDRPEKDPADKALEKIRAARRPSEEIKALRDEIQKLQKREQDFEKDLETIKKKLEPKTK